MIASCHISTLEMASGGCSMDQSDGRSIRLNGIVAVVAHLVVYNVHERVNTHIYRSDAY